MKMLFTIDEISEALGMDKEAVREMLINAEIEFIYPKEWITREQVIDLIDNNPNDMDADLLLEMLLNKASDLYFD